MSELQIEAKADEVGFDAGRLTRIDQHFARYVDDGRLPGWLIAIARHGRIAHLSTYGERDKEHGQPIEIDTLFRIYSMTKPITAVAALMLYEEGAFELKDPIHRFIPAFRNMQVYRSGSAFAPVTGPAVEPIRMWHLLTHTAGLTYGFHHAHPVDAMYRSAGFEWGTPPDLDLEACCDKWAQLPLLFHPGTEWNYSVATDVLGRVVEVLSGQSLDAFFAERIFEPLGMTDTAFSVDRVRTRSSGRAVHARRGSQSDPHRRDGQGRPQQAEDVLRRRRTRVDRARLPPVRPDAAARRRARRHAPAQPADRGDDGEQSPPRRRRPRGVRPPAVRRDDVRRCRASASACRSPSIR